MVTTVMGLGRGLRLDTSADFPVYLPSHETDRRANEMVEYYHAHPDTPMQLLVSGGYPEVASRGIAKRPPPGRSEAALMKALLIRGFVPEEIIDVEGLSGSTYDNFIRSIEAGFLRPGQFDVGNPLHLSVSRRHSWRSTIIARQALEIPNDWKSRPSVLRLRGGNLENGLRMDMQERVALALTKLALLEVDAKPGNLDHTREASEWFNEQIQDPFRALRKVGRHLGYLLSVPNVPQVAPYATTA